MRRLSKSLVIGGLSLGFICGAASPGLALPKQQTFHCACDCSYNGQIDHTVNFSTSDCSVAIGMVCQVEVPQQGVWVIRNGEITGCLGTAASGTRKIDSVGVGIPPVIKDMTR